MQSWDQQQLLHLGACWNHRISDPQWDLLILSLHFYKVLSWCVCILSCEKFCLKESPPYHSSHLVHWSSLTNELFCLPFQRQEQGLLVLVFFGTPALISWLAQRWMQWPSDKYTVEESLGSWRKREFQKQQLPFFTHETDKDQTVC